MSRVVPSSLGLPDSGWSLDFVMDNAVSGSLGACALCGAGLRYEHHLYHRAAKLRMVVGRECGADRMTIETQERARILEPELRARGAEFALWRATASWTRDKRSARRRWHRAGVSIEESVDAASGNVQWLWSTVELRGSEATALDAMRAAFEAVYGPPMELDLVPWSELFGALD